MKPFLVALFVALSTVGCTAREMQFWRYWQAATSTCHGAVDYLWPAESRAWAHRIVDRESGGNPWADNPTSTASGCFQIIYGTWLANQVAGCPWPARYDARCNTATALKLYRVAGTAPWM